MVDMDELEDLMGRNKRVIRIAYFLIFLLFCNIVLIFYVPGWISLITSIGIFIVTICNFVVAKKINVGVNQMHREMLERQKKKDGG